MGMNESFIRIVLWLDSHLTNPLVSNPFPAPIPLNSEKERSVKWVPDGFNSWRIVYSD